MLGLEISINKKKLCTAGIENGSLSATVATVGKAQATADNSQTALLTVSGFIETAKTYSHPWWVPSEAIPHLNAGDMVTIRVVNVDPGEVDRPSQTHRKLKQKPAQKTKEGRNIK